MSQTADVIVVGGGVHGASLAFHLACRGVRPVVLERSSVGAGATGRSSGMVRMHYDVLAETRLALLSHAWFRDWKDRVGGECGFTQVGFLQLVSGEHAARLRANVAEQQAIGVRTEALTPEEVRAHFPALSIGDNEAAAWEPESGYADPSATAAAFMRAAVDRGARLVQGVQVTGIRTTGGAGGGGAGGAGSAIAGVLTSRGDWDAPVVVDAAGGWAAEIATMVDLEIPVKVWRHDTAYLGVPAKMARPLPAVIDHANAMYFRPEGGNLVLVGLEDENEIGGSPDRETASAAAGFEDLVVDRVILRVPAISDGTFRSAHSGQDGITPDQHAILGQAGPDGFYLDCGHSGTGFKTAPAVGLAISELILDGAARSVDITPFGPERFAAGRKLVGDHSYGDFWR